VNSTGNCWALSVTLKFDSASQMYEVDGEENDRPKRQQQQHIKFKKKERSSVCITLVSTQNQQQSENDSRQKGACRYGTFPSERI
jgi:hypothetical protein